MTNAQTITAKQIINEYEDLFDNKPISVTMSGKEILIRKNCPILHPYYKILNNGTMLFGIGTEYTEYGMLVIGINRWRLIKPNGEILDKSAYSNTELELTNEPIEISAFRSKGDLIRF